jgi:hypothetical protein
MDLVALKARKLESARKSCSSQTLAIGFMLGIAQILGDFNHFAHHVIRVRWPWGQLQATWRQSELYRQG